MSLVNESIVLSQKLSKRFLDEAERKRIENNRTRERIFLFVLLIPILTLNLFSVYSIGIIGIDLGFEIYIFGRAIKKSGLLQLLLVLQRLLVAIELSSAAFIQIIPVFFWSNTLFWVKKAW